MEAYGAPVVAVHGFAGGKRAPGAEVGRGGRSRAFLDCAAQRRPAAPPGASTAS